jgi:hypothetical protein
VGLCGLPAAGVSQVKSVALFASSYIRTIFCTSISKVGLQSPATETNPFEFFEHQSEFAAAQWAQSLRNRILRHEPRSRAAAGTGFEIAPTRRTV